MTLLCQLLHLFFGQSHKLETVHLPIHVPQDRVHLVSQDGTQFHTLAQSQFRTRKYRGHSALADLETRALKHLPIRQTHHHALHPLVPRMLPPILGFFGFWSLHRLLHRIRLLHVNILEQVARRIRPTRAGKVV